MDKNVPALTRQEAALAAARAEVAVVSASFERTHIRAPIDATVLELRAKLGETANPAGETPLLVLGDTSHLQVRAEVQERDVRKIYPGQPAAIKSDAFPNRSFDAKVSVIARALSPTAAHDERAAQANRRRRSRSDPGSRRWRSAAARHAH